MAAPAIGRPLIREGALAARGPAVMVQTVLGPLEPERLGITLMHEHMLLDTTCYFRESEHASVRRYRDIPFFPELTARSDVLHSHHLDSSRLFDERVAMEEAVEFRHAGGSTLLGTTPRGQRARPPGARPHLVRRRPEHNRGLELFVTYAHSPDMDQRAELAMLSRLEVVDD